MNIITKIALVDIDENNNMLWVKKRGLDTWILPGGKRKPDESDRECLQRELIEELQTNAPDDLYYALSCTYPAVGEPDTFLHLHMFYGRLNPRHIMPSNEIEYAAYFPIYQLIHGPIPEDFKTEALPWFVELTQGRVNLPNISEWSDLRIPQTQQTI